MFSTNANIKIHSTYTFSLFLLLAHSDRVNGRLFVRAVCLRYVLFMFRSFLHPVSPYLFIFNLWYKSIKKSCFHSIFLSSAPSSLCVCHSDTCLLHEHQRLDKMIKTHSMKSKVVSSVQRGGILSICANTFTYDWSQQNACSTYSWLEISDDSATPIPIYNLLSWTQAFSHTVDGLNDKTLLELIRQTYHHRFVSWNWGNGRHRLK